jgi:streptogramin lyase
VWVSVQGTHYILRVPRFGIAQRIHVPDGGPYDIASNSATRVFFTEGSLTGMEHYSDRHIGSIDTAGHYRAYTLPKSVAKADDITAAPDGGVWFVDYDGGHVGHLDSKGSFHITALLPGVTHPTALVDLPSGTAYFGAHVLQRAALFELTDKRLREVYRLPYVSSIGLIATNGRRVCFTTVSLSKPSLLGCFEAHALKRTLDVKHIPQVRQLGVDPNGAVWLVPPPISKFSNVLLEISDGSTRRIPIPGIVFSLLVSRSGVVWFTSGNSIAQLTDGR